MAKDKIEIPQPVNRPPEDEKTRAEHPTTVETTPKGVMGRPTTPSSSSRFEPPATAIEVPSHGQLYKGMKADSDLKKGILKVRPITLGEEKILTTNRLIQSGKAIDMVLENCIKSEVDPQQLLSADRTYILFYLRGMSYGLNYDFNVRCYRCGRDFIQTIEIDKLPIHEWNDPVEEPWEMVLPITGFKVVTHYMRGYEENLLIEESNSMKSFDDIDEDLGIVMQSLVDEVYDPEGNRLSEQEKVDFINSLIAGDTGFWREELDQRTCGIRQLEDIACPHCNAKINFNVPLDRNFFRPQRRKSR